MTHEIERSLSLEEVIMHSASEKITTSQEMILSIKAERKKFAVLKEKLLTSEKDKDQQQHHHTDRT